MEDALYAKSRERFDTSRTYQTLVGTLCWVTVCGLALGVAALRYHAPWWQLAITGGIALQAPVSAWRNHPHAWPVLYSAMMVILMITLMLSTG